MSLLKCMYSSWCFDIVIAFTQWKVKHSLVTVKWHKEDLFNFSLCVEFYFLRLNTCNDLHLIKNLDILIKQDTENDESFNYYQLVTTFVEQDKHMKYYRKILYNYLKNITQLNKSKNVYRYCNSYLFLQMDYLSYILFSEQCFYFISF